MGHAIKKGNKLGHKDIKLTSHSKMRAEERLGITSVEEVRKLAISARYKGISIKSLNKERQLILVCSSISSLWRLLIITLKIIW